MNTLLPLLLPSHLQLSLYSISFTTFILLLIFLLQKCLRSSPQSSPPSPPKLPIFGHLLNLGSLPHLTLQNYARLHGPLFLLRLGSVPTLVVSASDLARDIMKTHDLVFANRPKSSISDKLLYSSRDVAASPYGEYWRQMKSICVLHLLSNKRVQSFRHVREEEVKLMIEKIEQNPVGVNLTEIFSGLTNDVVCRVALGRKYRVGEDGVKFMGLLKEFSKLLGSFSVRDFIPWLGWIDWISGLDGKANGVAKELDKFFDRVIEDHMNPENRADMKNFDEQKDLVDVLLWIQRENSIGFPLEMKNIKALILDMFAAGTDTAYTVLEWAMSELLKHPEVMKKLKNEIGEIKGEHKGSYINEDDIDKMVYLKAIIKETLRLHTPIPLLVPRESIKPVKLRGYDIKPGTRVMINAWTIGRDPKVWEEAEKFQPERFLNSSIDFKGQDFELIPFGAGRRGCPGIAFATMVMEIALANLVHKFEWILPNGEDLDMSGASGLTIHRKIPLVATAVPC
ncbi:cytochrome P450 71A22-like [Cucumis melo var. makuwa]|uniref:Cytochrome P450 71A22-like n=2 Tax=Cucumis melo TaxID=3656 RepID=A0A5A7UWH3_CUCMM|nr:cytochrome P450 736A117-like [Cucumis melo]KAA0057821.1 cytochrome P450 71A22-like [Cucumis melo var. makuwa]